MTEITEGPGSVNPETGWRLAAVWSGGQTTGGYTVGEEFTAYYEAPGTPYTVELTFYTVGQVADEETETDWRELEAGDEPLPGEVARYAWNERMEFYNEPPAEAGGPIAESYEGGSYGFFHSIKAADEDAKRMALRDISYALCPVSELRKEETV